METEDDGLTAPAAPQMGRPSKPHTVAQTRNYNHTVLHTDSCNECVLFVCVHQMYSHRGGVGVAQPSNGNKQ